MGVLSFLPFEKEKFNTMQRTNDVRMPVKFEETAPYKLRKIVLDAGHGGYDTGCQTEHGIEKNNTLAITKRLGSLINARYPEIEIIYTRDKDEFIELNKRADIANKAKADLFISIHCNSTDEGSGASGTETYVLGNHRKDDNFEVARRENQSILLENDYKTQYDGFDPNSTAAYIIFSLYQNAYLDKSILFAKFVEENLQSRENRRSLGVKQAGFIVLKETAMPSVLIETGFLNHPRDGQFISSDVGQASIAESVLNAISLFKQTVEEYSDEKNSKSAAQVQIENGATQNVHNPTNNIAQNTTGGAQNVFVQVGSTTQNTNNKERKLKPRAESNNTTNPIQKPSEIKKQPASVIPQTISKKEEVLPAQLLANELTYKVQLSVENNDVRQTARFKNIPDLEAQKEGTQFKILKSAGTYYCNAVKVAHAMRQKGFDDAFIVAYKNGARVKVIAEKCYE